MTLPLMRTSYLEAPQANVLFLLTIRKHRGGDCNGGSPVPRVCHVLGQQLPGVARGVVLVDCVQDGVAVGGAVLVAADQQEGVAVLRRVF